MKKAFTTNSIKLKSNFQQKAVLSGSYTIPKTDKTEKKKE